MKRWAICKLGQYEEQGVIMPKVGLYTESRKTWSKDGFNWGVCRFAIDDLTAIQQDNEIHILPDATLDASWGSIPSNIRNAVKTKVEAAGFQFVVSTSWTVKRILNYLANQLQPNIDCTLFDVRDVEP